MPDSGSRLVVDDFESMSPVVLTPHRGPMSDDEFFAFCEKYPDCMVEVEANGEIVIMPPANWGTSSQNRRITARLSNWTDADGRGEVLESSGAIRLANGARRAADAAWFRKSRIDTLSARERGGALPFCPDFVIELRPTSDRLRRLKAKMVEYIENGAELGWLIDPIEKQVWIYRQGREPEVLENPRRVEGEGPVAGFTLDLAGIID